MIVPLTDDAEWLKQFADSPPLDLPDSPVLVLAPHPDDETLGAGSLIATLRARGIPVTVVAATDGENAYDTPANQRAALGLTREREQQEALADLGIAPSAIQRLHLVDSGLADALDELTDRLLALAEPGMTLIAPWIGDFHPDHEACARAASVVAHSMHLPLLSYFFWTWHRGLPTLLEDLPLRRFHPGPDALSRKARALSRHQSQFEQAAGDPILSNRLLAPARWPFEVFLPA